MPKYNFYRVVYRTDYSEDFQQEIYIAKSKQVVKKKFNEDIEVVEILKIDKIGIDEHYKEVFKEDIGIFISYSKLKKFKIIIFNPENEATKITTVLAESKREIFAKYIQFKVFYISSKLPSFDEYCKYYFE